MKYCLLYYQMFVLPVCNQFAYAYSYVRLIARHRQKSAKQIVEDGSYIGVPMCTSFVHS